MRELYNVAAVSKMSYSVDIWYTQYTDISMGKSGGVSKGYETDWCLCREWPVATEILYNYTVMFRVELKMHKCYVP